MVCGSRGHLDSWLKSYLGGTSLSEEKMSLALRSVMRGPQCSPHPAAGPRLGLCGREAVWGRGEERDAVLEEGKAPRPAFLGSDPSPWEQWDIAGDEPLVLSLR